MTSNNIIINKKIIITIAHNILPWRSFRAKRDGSSFVFTNKFPLSIVQLYIPFIQLQKQISHLSTQILNLQITICWDFLNPVSHKVKQSPEKNQGPRCNTSVQTFQLTQPWLQGARKIHNNGTIEKHFFIVHRNS